MYSKSKYIVGTIGVFETAVVFPETVGHNEVAPIFNPGSIVGAGFCHYEENGVKVYGESISLRVKSRPDDVMFVSRAMSHPDGVI